jgi:hypothetical protein
MRMTMESTDSTAFNTRDFWLAGALLASGRRLLGLEWSGGRAFFLFADASACKRAAEAYWAGELSVGARAFADALRLLKDRLHARHGHGDEDGREPAFRR